MASQCLKTAYRSNVEPLLAMARKPAGGRSILLSPTVRPNIGCKSPNNAQLHLVQVAALCKYLQA